jgi:ATP-dependent protease ClpP protease subunit
MKHHSIIGRIDAENYNSLINFLNESQGEQKSILINSGGGDVAYCYAILHALDKVVDEVELVAAAGIYSAAFVVFYNFKGRKGILPYCKGMIHRPTISVVLDDRGTLAYKEDECHKKTMKESEKEIIEDFSKFFTKKELAEYKKGNDVYFTYNRMKEIFNL